MKLPLLAGLALAALAACDDGPAPLRDLPLPTDTAPPVEAPAATTAIAAPGDGTSASAGASAVPSLATLAGAWEGAYDAKKGRIDMPEGVRDTARAADDGKTAAGPGSVKITIGADGDVSGTSQGVLGAASVRGKLDGKMLRCSFVPDDPLAPKAMTGVLVGIVKGDVIVAEIRAAGPDAVLVREAKIELKKK